MIAALSGRLSHIDTTSVQLESGTIVFELLVCVADIPQLEEMRGQTITLQTLCYLEGDPNRGNLEPRLIGFLSPRDKRFFEVFTTVNGIGPRKALKALNAPIADVARAIESGNTRFLVDLPQIGKRLAEQIIATLSGKLGAFLEGPVTKPLAPSRRNTEEDAAIAVLSSPQMGLRRAEAEALLDRVKESLPELKTAEQFVPEMLKLHSSR
ncbi:MAG TPA: Holliday junction branch migration protein RuvA [Tepidisphaeraceae bacterium]|nr:Holliday junction branch migration protein RuvA [Tepidisphaeraceae bacterium]